MRVLPPGDQALRDIADVVPLDDVVARWDARAPLRRPGAVRGRAHEGMAEPDQGSELAELSTVERYCLVDDAWNAVVAAFRSVFSDSSITG